MANAAPEPVAWAVSIGPVPYAQAVAAMEARAAAISNGAASELVWLLEHPPLYTSGTSANDNDLLDARFPVHKSGRGGQLTYHGPGQRIAYLMLDVRARFGNDIRAFVRGLEAWVIDALASLGVHGRIVPGRVGVWVGEQPGKEAKIAALGVRIRRGISLHGISLNVSPDLDHYGGIVPCGISDRGVTSLHDQGIPAVMKDVDNALRIAFERRFGLVHAASDPRRPAIIRRV
jgi:lipoyl(octanoyl) transferase